MATPNIGEGIAYVDFSPVIPSTPPVTGSYSLELKRYQAAIQAAEAEGITLPSEIHRAVEVVETVKAHAPAITLPSVQGRTAEEILKDLDAYIEFKAQEAARREARKNVLTDATDAVGEAMRLGVDPALSKLAERFQEAARAYLAGHQLAIKYPSPADLIEEDSDGSLFTTWQAARTGAVELSRLVALIMPFRVNRPDLPAHHELRVTLFADYSGSQSVKALSWASDEARKGAISKQLPFGVTPLVVESGGSLSLPASAEDWDNRLETYRAIRDGGAIDGS